LLWNWELLFPHFVANLLAVLAFGTMLGIFSRAGQRDREDREYYRRRSATQQGFAYFPLLVSHHDERRGLEVAPETQTASMIRFAADPRRRAGNALNASSTLSELFLKFEGGCMSCGMART